MGAQTRSPVFPKPDGTISRRNWLAAAATACAAMSCAKDRSAVKLEGGRMKPEPFFHTRGVIIIESDIATWPWLDKAQHAGLNTISLHVPLPRSEAFVQSEAGQAFLAGCRERHLNVEREMHAIGDLLPRTLFDKDPSMFRMGDAGRRTPDANICVSSKAAIEVVRENIFKYAQVFRPTTSRYFFWIDDARPMCRSPQCKALSDSDQALLIENEMLKTLRRIDPRATLAHLCYQNTLTPPSQVKPDPGVFLEFAPIERTYDQPLSCRDVPAHAKLLDALDANLAVFGTEGAQILEYWLDVSRFSRWDRAKLTPIPWNNDVFLDDLATYAKRGIRHVTTFAVWLDGEYVARFGEPPLQQYGDGLLRISPMRRQT